MCYEPVREFASRPPLHEGAPEPERSWRIRLTSSADELAGGHYSRWNRTATTFGPAGRLIATALLVAWVVNAFFSMFVIFWLTLVSVVGWILREIWKPGWVPAERIVGSAARMPAPRALHPEPATPPAPRWIPPRTRVAWIGLGTVILAASLAFAYGGENVQAFVMMGGSLTLLVGWFAYVSRS